MGDALRSLAKKEKVKCINWEQLFISFFQEIMILTFANSNSLSSFRNEMLSILEANDKIRMTRIIKMNQTFVLIIPSKCIHENT